MPPTDDEMLRAAHRVSRLELAPDEIEDIVWADGCRITLTEQRDVSRLACYLIRRDREYTKAAQRKALRLLPAFLTQEQRRQMRSCHYFYVTAASGAVYRLYPYVGMTRGVTRHKTRWFETRAFCLHDYPQFDERQMPPADLCIAHLLWLLTDEAAFLRAANMTPIRLSMWDGDWRRQLNQAQRARAEQAQTHAQVKRTGQ